MPSRKTRKRKVIRREPSTSATFCREGTIDLGQDHQKWVVKRSGLGVKRWAPYHSATLFGYAPLTASILAANINKPIRVYERERRFTWPTKPSEFDVKYTFTATGDASKGESVFAGWLKKRTPAVKKNDTVILEGDLQSKDISATLQVGPLPAELVSSKLMNTEAFVRV